MAYTPQTWTDGVSAASAARLTHMEDGIENADTRLTAVETWVDAIYDTTLTGTASSLDITSIPGTFAHLEIFLYARGATAASSTGVVVRFNNDSGANYDWHQLAGAGTVSATLTEAVAATSAQVGAMAAASAPANLFTGMVINVQHYAGATNQKVALARTAMKQANSAGNIYNLSNSVHWRSAAAINRITLIPGAGDFAIGTRVTIRGVAV